MAGVVVAGLHMSDLLRAVRMPYNYYGTPLDMPLYHACVEVFVYSNQSHGTYFLHPNYLECLPDDKYGLLVSACSELGLSEITMELLHLRPASAPAPLLRL